MGDTLDIGENTAVGQATEEQRTKDHLLTSRQLVPCTSSKVTTTTNSPREIILN